jgi:hypothetical protein
MYALLLLLPNRIPFTDVKQVQRIFWKFYTNDTVSIIDLQNMPDDEFEDYISTDMIACIREVLRKYSPRYSANERQVYVEPQHQMHPQMQMHERIGLELCVKTSGVNTSSETVAECGICLSDNIPCSNMVKLGCGHEFCGDCAEMFINVKPCCAFCRATIKKVSVGSEVVLSKYKENRLFVAC